LEKKKDKEHLEGSAEDSTSLGERGGEGERGDCKLNSGIGLKRGVYGLGRKRGGSIFARGKGGETRRARMWWELNLKNGGGRGKRGFSAESWKGGRPLFGLDSDCIRKRGGHAPDYSEGRKEEKKKSSTWLFGESVHVWKVWLLGKRKERVSYSSRGEDLPPKFKSLPALFRKGRKALFSSIDRRTGTPLRINGLGTGLAISGIREEKKREGPKRSGFLFPWGKGEKNAQSVDRCPRQKEEKKPPPKSRANLARGEGTTSPFLPRRGGGGVFRRKKSYFLWSGKKRNHRGGKKGEELEARYNGQS